MASLLSWLGSAAKKVGQTEANFVNGVGNAIGGAVNHQVAPVAQATTKATTNFVQHPSVPTALSVPQAAFGATLQQGARNLQTTANLVPKIPVVNQVSRVKLPLVGTVGQGVNGLVNQGVIQPLARTASTTGGVLQGQKVANPRQYVSDAAQTALNAVTGGEGKLATTIGEQGLKAAVKALPKVALKSAGKQAILGGAQGAVQSFRDKASLPQTATSVALNAGLGGAVGAALPATSVIAKGAGAALKELTPKISDALKMLHNGPLGASEAGKLDLGASVGRHEAGAAVNGVKTGGQFKELDNTGYKGGSNPSLSDIHDNIRVNLKDLNYFKEQNDHRLMTIEANGSLSRAQKDALIANQEALHDQTRDTIYHDLNTFKSQLSQKYPDKPLPQEIKDGFNKMDAPEGSSGLPVNPQMLHEMNASMDTPVASQAPETPQPAVTPDRGSFLNKIYGHIQNAISDMNSDQGGFARLDLGLSKDEGWKRPVKDIEADMAAIKGKQAEIETRGTPARDGDGNSYLKFNTKDKEAYDKLSAQYHELIGDRLGAMQREKLQMSTQTSVSPRQPRVTNKSGLSTIDASASDLVKERVAAQEAARKGVQPGIKAKVGNFVADAKEKLIDAAAPIEDILHQAQKDGANIKPSENISYQIDRVLRSPTLAGRFAEDHGIADVIAGTPNLDELNQYLIAKHAQDLKVKEIKTGRDAAADAKIVKELGPKYEADAKVIGNYSKELLNYAVSKGLVNRDLAKYLRAEYPNYVPVNRIFSESELNGTPQGTGKGVASLGSQKVVQRIKGSEREIENPITSLLAKTNDAFQQGERNDAARMLASYKDLPGNPFGLRELKPDETIGNKPVISYLDKGVKKNFETTPEIARAAKNLNVEQIGLLGKILAAPVRALRLGATGLNLPFIASNLAKDQVTAFINSDKALATSIANPKNFLRAVFHATTEGKEYEELVRHGAGGNSFDIGRNQAHLTVAKLRAQRSITSNALYHVKHPGDIIRYLEDFVGKSENVGRVQQFTGTRDALLKQGHSLEDANILAAHAARSNTTNFARAGSWGRVLNTSVAYLNAGVQGSRTLVRNLQTRPQQTAAKLAMTTFFPVAAITAWNLSDPKRKAAYDNILESEKGGNLVIVPPNPTKDAKGRWNVIKVPLSQEVANLADIVRNGVEAAGNDKNINIAAIAGDLLGTASSLNVGSPRQLVGQLLPQAFKPAIEALVNQNLYSGVPIIPQNLQNYPAGMQYKPTTSGTAVKLGKTLGISPLEIENFASTAGGGVGRQLLNASDHVLAATGQIQPSQIGGQDAADNTIAKFTKATGQSDASIAYQQKQQAAKAKAAQGVPKALAQAGLEGDGSMKGIDPKTQTRIETASKTIAQATPQSAKQTLLKYASLDAAGKKDFNANPANVYQLHLAQYNNDVASNKLTPVEQYKTQQSLGREAITSKYSKDVQDFYALSKTAQKAFISANPTVGNQLYAQAQQLDSELAGHQFTTTKYKYGLGTKGKSSRSGRKSVPKINLTSQNTKLAKLASSVKVKSVGVKIPKSSKARTIKVPKITQPKLAKAKLT